MSENIIDFPSKGEADFIVGPFAENRVVIEGRMIPRMTAIKEADGTTLIVVDRRFGVSVPNVVAYQVAWLVANALAIGEGYSHLGAETKDRPFAPLSQQLDSIPTE